MALIALAYYLLLSWIAARACNRVIVLVDSPNAPITKIITRILGCKNRIQEEVHPPFKPKYIHVPRRQRGQITITCLGGIRHEKGYHVLLKWLASLKHRDSDLYSRIRVVIAGAIDRKKLQDLEYLRNLIKLIQEHRLENVDLVLKRLTRREFEELIASSDIVWCAYTKKYGPSGILAWTRTYGRKTVYVNNFWGSF